MKKRVLSVLLVMAMILAAAGCKKDLPEQTDKGNTEGKPVQGDTDIPVTGDTDLPAEDGDGADGEQLTPEDGAELLFWTTDVAFGNAVGKAFTEEYGVAVEVAEVGLDAMTKISLDGPAGTGADVFIVPHDSVQQGISAGLFQELDTVIAKQLEDTVSTTAYNVVTSGGKQYGVPFSIETSALFYNKSLIAEPASSMEQIMEEAKSFNDVKENKFYILYPLTGGYAAYPFLSAAGFQLFGADGTDADKPGFDSPEFVQGLRNVAEFYDTMPLSSENLKMSGADFLDNSFIEGKTAYIPNGPWSIKKYQDAGVDFGIAPLPTYKGEAMMPFAGVMNAHVSPYSKYPNAAQLFALYLVSEKGGELLYSEAAKITARADISNIKGLSTDEFMKPFVDQFKEAVPMPTAKRISYYWSISESILSSVYDKKLTPEDGALKAQEDFDALVQSE